MIIHAYFTDGYFDWAKLFVESFAFHNDNNYKIILHSKDLKESQINELYKLYNNLEVRNEKINWDDLEKKSGISKKNLKQFKSKTEKEKVNQNIKVWKLMIAGDDRIKTIYNLLKETPENDHVAHFDIDTYITGNLEDLFNFVKENDFCTIYRIKKQIRKRGLVRPHRATLINFMGFTVNKKSKKFMKTWINYIDKVHPAERTKGYGQTSCYYAYLDMIKNKDFKTGDIKKYRNWASAQKGGKNMLYEKYRKDFEERKNKLYNRSNDHYADSFFSY